MQAFCRPPYSTVKWLASRQSRFLHTRVARRLDRRDAIGGGCRCGIVWCHCKSSLWMGLVPGCRQLWQHAHVWQEDLVAASARLLRWCCPQNRPVPLMGPLVIRYDSHHASVVSTAESPWSLQLISMVQVECSQAYTLPTIFHIAWLSLWEQSGPRCRLDSPRICLD